MLKAFSPQRGNVTIITAVTACLMLMLVMLASGLSENASAANRMQAASDAAAITAATSYISVVNDQVLLDTIDWGLAFVQRMAQILEQIGNAIAAIPFVEGVGIAIAAAAEFVQAAVEDMQSVFDDVIKTPLEDVLDEAKSYLGLINATIHAANNNYLGFIVPAGSLKDGIKNAAPITYDLNYVKRRVAHAHQVIDVGSFNDGLPGQIQRLAAEQVWGKAPVDPTVDPSKNTVTPPPCPTNTTCTDPSKESRLGIPNDPNRDTFHFWDSTPGCTDPWPLNGFFALVNPNTKIGSAFFKNTQKNGWHRPCNEFYWLDHLMASYYWHEWGALDQVKHQLFYDPKLQTFTLPGVFTGSDADRTAAIKMLDDTKDELLDIATGNGGDGDHGQIGLPTDGPANGCDGGFMPHTWMALAMHGCFDQWHDDKCPFGAASRPKLGPYFSFKCDGGLSSTKVFDANPPDNKPVPRCTDPAPCHVFWGMDQGNTGKVVGQYGIVPYYLWPDYVPSNQPLAQHQATDYRAAPFRSQERGAASKAVSEWQAARFDCSDLDPAADHTGCPTAGADSSPTSEVEEDFIEVGTVKANLPTELAAKLTGQKVPDDRYAITGSKARVYRARSVKDRVRVDNLCPHIFTQDNKNDPNDYDKVLGFLPSTGYGWCHVLLSSFQLFIDIRNAIQDFFDPIIHALDSICIPIPFSGDLCLFKWAGDLLQDLVDFVLGPKPPDTRTYHVALETVGCIPQLAQAADIARHPDHLVSVVIAAKGFSSDTGSGTCK